MIDIPVLPLFPLLCLVDTDPLLPQIHLGLLNLSHQFLVRLRNIVEREDAVAEFEEEEAAEGYDDPEGKLHEPKRSALYAPRAGNEIKTRLTTGIISCCIFSGSGMS